MIAKTRELPVKLLFLAIVFGVCELSYADVILTFSEAAGGGTRMTATNGTSTGNATTTLGIVSIPVNGFEIFSDVIPPNLSETFLSASHGGTVSTLGVLAPDDVVVSVDLTSDPAFGDEIALQLDSTTLGGGGGMADTIELTNVVATWSSGVLPFSDLTPGSYTTSVGGVSVVVVPEPSAFFCLGAIALGAVPIRLSRPCIRRTAT